MNKIRIAICGLTNSENLGEAFIADSLEFLIENAFEQEYGRDITLEFCQIDILMQQKYPAVENQQVKKNIMDYLYLSARAFSKRVKSQSLKNLFYFFQHMCWKHGAFYGKRINEFFQSSFENSDIIVVDGAGLLEYSFNEYQESLLLISKIAEEKKIPVLYNAIGTAGAFNTNDYRCRVLMKAMHSPAIRYVSARDSKDLVQNYVGENLVVQQYADAAVCLSEAYNIRAKDNRMRIGIGLIRGTALQSYNTQFFESEWIDLFCDIALELQKRGYDFYFFTNGFIKDYELGEKVIERLSLSSDYLINRPVDAHQLAETISGFSAMITCRMHSVIAGFSMGIPAIALSWNTKLNKFMTFVGNPDRVIDVSEFEASIIVDKMEKSLNQGYTKKQLEKMKKLARQSVNDYIDIIYEAGVNRK